MEPLPDVLAARKKNGEMAERQKAAFDVKRKAIQGEVDKVLSAWLDRMDKDLPADVKKYEKVKSPLVRWRLDSFNFDWRRPMAAAVVLAPGTAPRLVVTGACRSPAALSRVTAATGPAPACPG